MSFPCAAVKLLPWLAAALCAAQAPAPVQFKTRDGWTIAGIYQTPRLGKPVAILIHGVGSSKNEWERIAPQLWSLGLGTLAIDLRGHEKSASGPRGPVHFREFDAGGEWPRATGDIEAALAFLKRRKIPASRIGLIGASIGANLASQAAQSQKELPWIILLSPGQDYRGVPAARLEGRRVLLAASRPDYYAFQTCARLASQNGFAFLEARQGHGAQMLDDPDFLRKFLDWIAEAR
ncbi:MAG: hypothetical protein A3J74_01150 [Elusimicrobia bacterium RIFCSPHIGHO2_02_FULL_57_9]|nr:MAG: hypothetical protein A3J74_01150 [Elusimicrobia bacterium RIFCSPHIGHO2_02_FULL_57_9]